MSKPLLTALATALLSAPALAHEGHGPAGAHWHATDVWGFVALGVAVGVAIWFGRRK